MAGRGRAFLFNKNKPPSDDSPPVASSDPPKPRGRAAFLQVLRQERDAQTTVSGSDESGIVLSSGDATTSTATSSDRPRGRAALFASKSSTSGAYSADSSSLATDVQNLKIVEDAPEAASPYRGSPDKEKPPPVMKHGMSGRKCEVAVNYVRLDLLDPNRGIWEYDVIFGSQVDNKYLKSRLVNMHFMALGGKVRVYDMGSKLYTPMKTPEEETSAYYELRNGDKVKVTFKRKCERKLADCRVILNIIMNRIKGELKLISFGRSDFNPQAKTEIPQHKLEVWPGCITAVEEYEGGILLNCDVSHRVLQNSTIYDIITDCCQSTRGQGASVFQDLTRTTLLGQSVITKYNNKHVRIDDIDFDKTPMSTFEKNGQQVTYVQYYEDHYNLKVKDKGQPLLMSRVTKKPIGMETVDIINYYIPELCSPTGLTDDQRKNFKLMKDVNAITQLTPPQRDQALTKFLKGIYDNDVCRKMLEDWGLKMPTQPIELTGRTLEPETIHLGNKRTVTEPNADWGRALSNNAMLVPIDVKDWAIIYTARDTRQAMGFLDKCQELARKIGVCISKPRSILVESDHPRAYCAKLKEVATLQIAVIIFPTQRDDRYSAVKKLCNVDLGLPSQVINSRTLQKDSRALNSVVLKILLQINCKLGGSLWGVGIPHREDGVMFCGIDVYHEAGQGKSSIIAFVASINKVVTRWTSGTARHARGQEITDKIVALFRDGIQQYYTVNGSYPKRIVMFRDGVGDGQLKTVRDFEIPQFKKLFNQVSQDYSPMLTYMVVQKRINTRFYIKQRGKMDNPPPGTVLDHTVTRRNWYDFFLVSQNVRQGTVAPTHYIIIEDSSDMSADLVQKLTYKMTHLYYNWNGTVRVPAPCQYAHKLAYLVGQHVHDSAHEQLRNTLYFL